MHFNACSVHSIGYNVIFAMFYIHDRRVWVWIRPDGEHPGQSRMLAAMTSQRRTLDFEHAFARLKTDIQRLCDPSDNLRE